VEAVAARLVIMARAVLEEQSADQPEPLVPVVAAVAGTMAGRDLSAAVAAAGPGPRFSHLQEIPATQTAGALLAMVAAAAPAAITVQTEPLSPQVAAVDYTAVVNRILEGRTDVFA
jgi:hypothetical protein